MIQSDLVAALSCLDPSWQDGGCLGASAWGWLGLRWGVVGATRVGRAVCEHSSVTPGVSLTGLHSLGRGLPDFGGPAFGSAQGTDSLAVTHSPREPVPRRETETGPLQRWCAGSAFPVPPSEAREVWPVGLQKVRWAPQCARPCPGPGLS